MDPDRKDELWTAYREADLQLRADIGKACFRAWKLYVTDEDNPHNPWGPAHRICHAASNKQNEVRIFEQADNLRAKMEEMQRLKFPDDDPSAYTEEMQAVSTIYGKNASSSLPDFLHALRTFAAIPSEPPRPLIPYTLRPSSQPPVNPPPPIRSPNVEPIDELHMRELERIVRELDADIAPGPDCIGNMMIQKSFYFLKRILFHLYNACLKHKHFPKIWKTAAAIYIPKPGRSDMMDTDSYRPISLLSNLGKILERIIKDRMEFYAEPAHLNSDKQFGFRRGGSTIKALNYIVEAVDKARGSSKKCALISFDIKGAFDHCWWPNILRIMHQRAYPTDLIELIASYFTDRSVHCSFGNVSVSKSQSRGCPQGSVLSPLLWNLNMDPLLRYMEAERNPRRSFAAYADDLSVVLEADDEDSLLRDIKDTVIMIRNWFQNIGLQLNIGKCHVLTFQGTRIFPDTMIPLTAGTSIKVVNKVKILWLIIDRRLKFDDHVMSTINKLVPMRNAFFRLCPNTYGPDSRKRAIIYTQVYRAILTYGSEIWSNRITTQVRSKMVSFQHRFLVNVVQAYRTTSMTSVHTLSGVEPIDLFMKRKLMEFQAKDHTPGSDNPLTQLLLPNAPAHKRPIPEEIFFESPAEMAILSVLHIEANRI